MNQPDPEQRTTAPDGQPEPSQPDWRRHFPIDTVQDNEVARRDFTNFMVLTSLAFVVGQVWIVVQNRFRGQQEPPADQAIARVEEIPVGGTMLFRYPTENDPCILLRPDAQTFLAYDQKCTHLSCAVVPEFEQGCLHCPCHNGYFDLHSGRAIAGPPRRPLTRITLEIRAGVIHATGTELRTV
jgi:Rieske Fe-S protein